MSDYDNYNKYNHYSMNWMGPVRPGYDGFACGRIDVRGKIQDEGEPFGFELGVPLIDERSWGGLRDMLKGFKTEDLWTWEQVAAEYERRSGRKIVYWSTIEK